MTAARRVRGDVVTEREVRDCVANRRFTFYYHKKTAGWKSLKTEVKGVKVSIKSFYKKHLIDTAVSVQHDDEVCSIKLGTKNYITGIEAVTINRYISVLSDTLSSYLELLNHAYRYTCWTCCPPPR